MITTTLKKIKDAKACVGRYTFLREALGKGFEMSTVLPLEKILETNGLHDCLWALDHAVEGGGKICRLFAADCAEHVLHIFLKERPTDSRPADAIKAIRAFARSQITDAARDAASAAAWNAASAAARAAARDAAWNARDAAWAAAWAAWDAATDAAWTAAWDAEQKWQTKRLIQYLKGEYTK